MNFSEWKINDANVKLVKNNTNGLYMLEITTSTGFIIELDLEDPETRIYASGNFINLNIISRKQSEVGVKFEPKNDYKDLDLEAVKINDKQIYKHMIF